MTPHSFKQNWYSLSSRIITTQAGLGRAFSQLKYTRHVTLGRQTIQLMKLSAQYNTEKSQTCFFSQTQVTINLARLKEISIQFTIICNPHFVTSASEMLRYGTIVSTQQHTQKHTQWGHFLLLQPMFNSEFRVETKVNPRMKLAWHIISVLNHNLSFKPYLDVISGLKPK